MHVLVIGSGGREHALCWAISASPLCDALFCAPGNAGIAEYATLLAVGAEDIDGIVALAQKERIDFVVVGPEAPLVKGLVDRLEAAGIKAFGPSQAAARLEGSKGFTKDICAKYRIPTAAYERFTDAGAARAYVRKHGAPIVVKADGLAAGKGVVVALTEAEALAAIDAMMTEKQFGAAGTELVIEEFMDGEEASYLVIADGQDYVPLASAQDHKRVGDGDVGPNTGGMGAYSPAPVVTDEVEAQIKSRVIGPMLAAMAAEGCPFKGILYAGLMITDQGPKVVEFNVRFGDPECQPLMLRLKSDLLPALIAARDGVLKHFDLRWHDDAAVCVVMAAKGYPGDYLKNTEIRNIAAADALDGVKVFHAGTRQDGARLVSVGGRVLGVTALGKTIADAQRRAYEAVDKIDWKDGFCRRDIGWRAIGRSGGARK
ncbi:MAG: phosphoribosylamine--glycine ligase [Alphaproteobacteria bacterium]